MELKRIYDIMLRYEERHPDQKIALSGKIGKNKWNEYTPKQYKKTADELSCALLAKGHHAHKTLSRIVLGKAGVNLFRTDAACQEVAMQHDACGHALVVVVNHR